MANCEYIWYDLVRQIIDNLEKVENASPEFVQAVGKLDKVVIYHNLPATLTKVYKIIVDELNICQGSSLSNKKTYIWFNLPKQLQELCDLSQTLVDCKSGEIVANNSSATYIKILEEFITSNNILENDTLNGEPVEANQVDIIILNSPAYATVDADGNIIIDTDTAPAEGEFEIQYQICIKGTQICSEATATIDMYTGDIKGVLSNPMQSCESGGTTLTLTGEGFYEVTSVTFDGIEAESFEVQDYFNMTAVTPAGMSLGLVDGAITNFNTTYGGVITINIIANPVVAVITGLTQICSDTTTDLNNASPGGVWDSSDESIATVDADGLVTGLLAGNVEIGYTVTDGGCSTRVTHPMELLGEIEFKSVPNQSVLEGSDAIFHSDTTGDITSYQWQVSTDDGETFQDVVEDDEYDGATTDTLTVLFTPEIFDGYVYQLVMNGFCGEYITNVAILNVGDVGIMTDPQSQAICENESLILGISVEGDVQSISWEEDQGVGFNPISDGTVSGLTYSGATTSTLTIFGMTIINNGWIYRAVVNGTIDTIYSNPAGITVEEC